MLHALLLPNQPEVTNISTWGNTLLKFFHFKFGQPHKLGIGNHQDHLFIKNMYYVPGNIYVMVNKTDVVLALRELTT